MMALTRLDVTLFTIHQLGFALGDIKPSNIYVKDDDNDIVDFGDFGGAGPLVREDIVEYSHSFLPRDLLEVRLES
jgi:serine/threonine protein kinase